MRENIICFLENLLTQYKDGKLTTQQEKQISEFFISYSFTDNTVINDEKELLKYAALGWFIYNNNKKN